MGATQRRTNSTTRREGRAKKGKATSPYYTYSCFPPPWHHSWTTTRKEAPPVSSSRSGASRAALNRVSTYSLAKEVGTEIVRYSDPTATAVTSPNHTRFEEASISASAFSRTRAHSSSAAGSGFGSQRGFQGLLGRRRGLGKGVALADGAHEEARAVADALLEVEGVSVAQAPLGAVGDHEVSCGVAAHSLAHQALYGEHLLRGARELQRLLPAGEGGGDAVEHAGVGPVLYPREEPLLLELPVGPGEGPLYLRGVGVVERDLVPHREEVRPPREAPCPLEVYEAVEALAQGHLKAPEEARVEALEV